MKKLALSSVAVIMLFAVTLYFMPEVFLPKRWLEIRPGHERSVVLKVLGAPDVAFFDKNFDGWHNPFYIGASVLTVRYDNQDIVVDCRIEARWGLEYRQWIQQYKGWL